MWRFLISSTLPRGHRTIRAAGVLGFFFALLAWSCSSSRQNIETFTQDGGGLVIHVDAGSDAEVIVPPDVATPPIDANEAASDALVCPGDAGPQQICDGICVSTSTDPKNCGGCGQACDSIDPDAGGIRGASCIKGVCKCATPLINCGNQCVDLTSDMTNCGFCGHNCQNNACTQSLCAPNEVVPHTSAPPVPLIEDIVVDNTNVYWTTGGGGGLPTGVFLKPFAGGNAVTIGQSVQQDPRGLAVDIVNVYWVDFGNGAIGESQIRAPTAAPTFLVPGLAKDAGPSPDQPVDIATDGANIYWTDEGSGTVNQKPRNGSPAIVLASGRNHPIAIAVDANFVYWADLGTTQSNTGSVNRIAIGQAQGTVTPLALAQDQPRDIAVDSANVYWTTSSNSGAVNTVPVTGGLVAALAQNQGGPWAITVDSQFVYWTNYNDNTIKKVSLSGGGVLYTLASKQNNPSAIAIDGKNVYWANQGDGSIWKVAK